MGKKGIVVTPEKEYKHKGTDIKEADDVFNAVNKSKNKKGRQFTDLKAEMKAREEATIKPLSKDFNQVDLSKLNPTDLKEKLMILQGIWPDKDGKFKKSLFGWDSKTKQAAVLTEEYIARKESSKKHMEDSKIYNAQVKR